MKLSSLSVVWEGCAPVFPQPPMASADQRSHEVRKDVMLGEGAHRMGSDQNSCLVEAQKRRPPKDRVASHLLDCDSAHPLIRVGRRQMSPERCASNQGKLLRDRSRCLLALRC